MTDFSIRGAYIARLNLADAHNFGVANKVKAEVTALRQPGVTVDLYHPQAGQIFCNQQAVCLFGNGRLAARLNYYVLFYIFLIFRLRGLQFIYVRYQRSGPLFLLMLALVRLRNPGLKVFVELPTYPYEHEWASRRDRLHGAIDRAFRGGLRWLVDHIVTFSRRERILGVPTIVTDNGVDVAALPLLNPPSVELPLRLLGLANLSFWHGYDRVITGIAAHVKAGGQPVYLEVVGGGNELPQLQRMVAQLELTDYVRFHGPLHGVAMTEVMSHCQIGIATIGTHRLNRETTDLKSREFCARGLPFVIGYDDHDFLGSLPFVFRAPASDEPLDIAAVLAFHHRLRLQEPDFSAHMRSYAESHLDWVIKLAPVNHLLRSQFT